MKITVLDGYCENPGDLSWDGLGRLGELTVFDRTPYDDDIIIERIADAEIVITNKTPILRKTIEACKSIRFVSVLATGYNVVDCACAAEKGIPVSNIPSYGTASVGQFAIAMLLEICHHVQAHSDSVHAGKWISNPDWCFWEYPLIELDGKTIGIIGFGKIGQTTGRIAKAMGMKVLATGSRPTPSGEAIAEYTDLHTVLSASDVIALHCPLFPETQGIINKDNIALMKDGVIIINNSRGALVVEQDLADALNSGKVYAAGIDVASCEPMNADNPLLSARNCLITPHISWAPKEARERIMEMTVNNIKAYMSGNPINVVNIR